MARSNFRKYHPVGSTSTQKSQPYNVSFRGGLQTYKPNDEMKDSELAVLDNNRFERIGRPKSRKGTDFYSVPIGQAINVQQTSTTGASTRSITTASHYAMKAVAASTGRATRVDVNLKFLTTAPSGVLLVSLHADNGGVPGAELAVSSFNSTELTSSFQYLTARFNKAPDLTSGTTYWVVLKCQESSTGSFVVSTTTSATTSLTSANSGVSWSASTSAGNFKLYTSTSGGVKGLYRAYRPSGTAETIFFHDDDLYKVTDNTGATAAIVSGLGGGITRARFEYVQDVIYYVTGIGKPRKYDFTTESQVTASPYNAYLIKEHKGLMFYADTADKTRLFYSNFAAYDTFTSTDFIYVPAPKSSAGLTAIEKLNGALYPFTRNNKYVLLGSDNATFSLDEAPGQKGTFSQESVVADNNNIYFASDDGVYEFNGTVDDNLAVPILQDYLDIPNKENIILDVRENRLYVFYTPQGAQENTECLVYNLLLKQWESRDTRKQVGASFARSDSSNLFIQGSNRVGALYYAEQSSNDYNELGAPIDFEIATGFMTFDRPDQKKRVTKWRPDFPKQDRSYNISCGYAFDGSTIATYPYNVSVGGSGARWDNGVLFDSGAVFADDSMIDPSNMSIPGEHKRIQVRYKHFAAREPVEVESHVLVIQSQRIK